jgi:hypothetical protein
MNFMSVFFLKKYNQANSSVVNNMQYTVYNRTVLKNGSWCTVRPGKVSCLQKFRHFWMIIRDLFFESGSNKKNTAKVCHLYF